MGCPAWGLMAFFLQRIRVTTRKEDRMSVALEVVLVGLLLVLPVMTVAGLSLMWPSGEPPGN